MGNTRLIKFLKALNHNELRQFRDFVNSPVFNKNKHITELFEILYKHYPGFDSPDLDEEKMFEKIFESRNFEYFKIKNLMSDLFAIGKEFLAFSLYKKDNHTKEKYLLQGLRTRNLDPAFEQAYKYSARILESSSVKDEFYFLRKLDLVYEIMSYYSPKKPNVNFHYFQERLDLFVNYAVIFLLKIYDVMLHENNQNNYVFDMKLFDHVMKYLDEIKVIDNPTLEVYHNIILLEKTKDEKYFYILNDLKDKYGSELSFYDNYMLYLHLDGYCATAFNDFCRTDLLQYQFLLATKHPVSDATEDGKILYPDFLNQIKKAVRVKEFDWAEDFLRKYSHKLTDEIENTLNFCYGYISYYKGEFDKALDYFSRTNFSNFILKVQVKILLIQISIDKKYYDQALMMIDAFRHYLAREKSILDLIKQGVMEFLKITVDFIKIRTSVRAKDADYKLSKIRQDIENMSNNRFGVKLWLREKTAEPE